MYSNHPHWLVLTYLQMSYAQDVTSHQLFFLNFAQVWCGTARPEALRNGTRIQNFNVYFCTQKERSYVLKIINASHPKVSAPSSELAPPAPSPASECIPPPLELWNSLAGGGWGAGEPIRATGEKAWLALCLLCVHKH